MYSIIIGAIFYHIDAKISATSVPYFIINAIISAIIGATSVPYFIISAIISAIGAMISAKFGTDKQR